MDKSQRNLILFALFMGFFWMLAGAFGAHGMSVMKPAAWLSFLIAWMVHAVHVLAALQVGFHVNAFRSRRLALAGGWLIGGAGVLFASSIYVRLFFLFSFGPLIPFLGLLGMAGWLLTAFALLRK
ncbi:DUF423 domain-containing protein [bacterium]|nr:DUF423 domain-containing protein [bacterium]